MSQQYQLTSPLLLVAGFSENHTTNGVHFSVTLTPSTSKGNDTGKKLLRLFKLDSNLNLL